MTPAGLKEIDVVTSSNSTAPPDDDIELASLNDKDLQEMRDRDRDKFEEDQYSDEDEEEDSDCDSEEERDGFSVGEDDDSASFVSSASSMATNSQSIGSETASSATGTAMEDTDRESQKIAQHEVRAAKCGRFTALFVLMFILGFLLPYLLHLVASNHEAKSFKTTVHSLSEDLGDAWRENVLLAFEALDAIAADSSMAVAAAAVNATWPMVTIPEFPVWSTQAHYASAAIQSNVLAPLVTVDMRSEYKQYVNTNRAWIEQSVEWKAATTAAQGKTRRRLVENVPTFTGGISDQIYKVVNHVPVVSPGPGPFFPIRHMHPIRLQSLNYDLASNSFIASELLQAMGNSSAALGKFLDETDEESKLLQSMLLPGDRTKVNELYGTIIYPVLDQIGSTGPGTSIVVGAVVAVVSWIDLFSQVLPSRAQGMVAVLHNSCGQVASVQVDGPDVTFLGYKDAHDRAFETYGHSYDLQGLGLEQRTTSRIHLKDNRAELCSFQLDVYPSMATKSSFETIDPISYVGIALGAFFITLLLFIIYDCFMERRNRAILLSAMEARAIVSSLFPANVRDRLFETNRVKRKKKKKLKKLKKKMKKLRPKKKKQSEVGSGDGEAGSPESGPKNAPLSPSAVQSILESVQPVLGNSLRDLGLAPKVQSAVSHPKHQLKNLLAIASGALMEQSEEFGLNKPIADLFPHTTVLFADIVG